MRPEITVVAVPQDMEGREEIAKGTYEDARKELCYAEDLKALCGLAIIRNTVLQGSKGQDVWEPWAMAVTSGNVGNIRN